MAPTDTSEPIPFLNIFSAGLTQILAAIPTLMAAYKVLHQIWAAANPGMTFEEYNARLLAESAGVHDFGTQWLLAKGYTQQPDGSWLPPVTPPADPV